MGCSTFTKHAEHDSGPLMGWAGKRNVAGMGELLDEVLESTEPDALPDALAPLTDEVTAMRMLRENKLTWADKRDKAGDEGNEAHDTLEALLRGGSVDWTQISPDARAKVQACQDFVNDYAPVPLQLESVVYSKTHGYAGRFDARLAVEVPAKLNGEDTIRIETWLLDLKTSGFIAPGYFVQLAAYEMAACECGIGSSDRRMILQVSHEGGYRLIESTATDEDVLACLHLHRRTKKELKAPKWDGQTAVAA